MAPRFGLKSYAETSLQSTALGGNPAELVVALYEGIVDALGQARILMERADLLEAGRRCSKALTILAGLRETLDFERGEPVASQLLQFYNVVTSRIISAQVRRDAALIAEAIGLMQSVKGAWQEVSCQGEEKVGSRFLASGLGTFPKPTAVVPSGAGAAAVL